jgi:hypothetical protein
MLLGIAKCGEKFERLTLGKCGKKSYGNLWHIGHETKQPPNSVMSTRRKLLPHCSHGTVLVHKLDVAISPLDRRCNFVLVLNQNP